MNKEQFKEGDPASLETPSNATRKEALEKDPLRPEDILAREIKGGFIAEQLRKGLDTRSQLEIAELEARAEQAEKLATIDSMTGLLNRKAGIEKILESASRVAEKGRRKKGAQIKNLTIVFLDIDKFKQVNDEYGHSNGDEVIKAVANRLTHDARITDTVARLGGEEFVLAFEDLDIEETLKQKFHLHEGGSEIAHLMIPVPITIKRGDGTSEQVNLPITVSGGITEFHQGENIADVLKRADDALYYAKRTGRNKVIPWDPSIPPITKEPSKA